MSRAHATNGTTMDASMTYIKTVSSKGQLAIPKRLCACLGIKPGDKVRGCMLRHAVLSW